MKTRAASPNRIIRDKEFPVRLNRACDEHTHVPPYNFGRLTWVREQLDNSYNTSVSLETVRKWFSGEARPRPDKMKKLAEMLHVDEAWLSLGRAPEMTPKEREAFTLSSNGAVNLVAGMIWIAGGYPALPDEDSASKGVNLYAILGGKQHSIHVAYAKNNGDEIKFEIPTDFNKCKVLGVIPKGISQFDLLYFEKEKLSKHAVKKGGHAELALKIIGASYTTGADKWLKISNFQKDLQQNPS